MFQGYTGTLDMKMLKNTTPYILTSIFSMFESPHNLLVDEIRGHGVVGGVVPGREEFLAEKQPPGGVALMTYFPT